MPKTISLSLFIGLALCFFAISALAEERVEKVKNIGNVSLRHYQCREVKDKNVHELCYAKKARSLIAKLGDNYHGFCGVPKSVYADWLKSTHKKVYFHHVVEGRYAC